MTICNRPRCVLAATLTLFAGAAIPAVAAKKATPKAPPKLSATVSAKGQLKLVDAKGKAVQSLKKGVYTVLVNDATKKANFHLKGKGVNKKTGVSFRGAVLWGVQLRPGVYTYQSDAGSKTSRSIKVR